MKVPVVFIHRNNCEYLNDTIKHAEVFNPEQVVLISDVDQQPDIAKYYNIDQYTEYADKFAQIYQSLSTTTCAGIDDYEMFCFQRWFILLKWMESTETDVCLYCDSDLLLYCNANEVWQNHFKDFDLTLTHRCVGSNSYFTRSELKKFCAYVFEVYANKNSFDFDSLATWFECMRRYNRGGGVCDMTLLERYARYRNPWGTGEMTHVFRDIYRSYRFTFDHCINQSDNCYDMQDSIKNLDFGEPIYVPYAQHRPVYIPSCRSSRFNDDVRFYSLHCQGGTKNLIKQLADINLT